MKIGFVLDDSLDKSDGVQHHVLTLGDYCRREGHEVHYLVGETKRADIEHVHSLSKNIKVHFNQNRMSTPLPANKQKIKQLLGTEKFDVLHVQMPYSPLLAGRIISAAPKETAVVATFHIVPYSWIESAGSRLLALWCKSSLQKINKVFSVSEPARQFLHNAFGTESEVIPNPIDAKKYSTGKKMKHLESKRVIVFLGRLVERKGCSYLLRALKQLADDENLEGVAVFICGTGPLEQELKQYVTANRLSSVVTFLGYVSEQQKLDYLASADLTVLPSTGGESFGIVITEAMAAGSDVVIAGRNAGYSAVLGEKQNQLVDPTDTQSFAAVLHSYLSSPAKRKEAKVWQAKHVRQFDVNVVGARLLLEYKSLLAKQNNN